MQFRLVGALSACGLLAMLTSANAQDAAPTPAALPATPVTAPAAAPSVAPTVPPAALVLGDTVILRLYSTGTNGPTPQDRVDALTTRITDLLGIPGILPSDVVVYAPKGSAPTIYTLGRRLMTLDPATAKAQHLGTPLQVASLWAARLQQVLPRINYRPSNMPEPNIPANPPLLVTDDFTKVGGMVGAVNLHGKNVIFFYGPQPHGLTAQERADQVSVHLSQSARKIQLAEQTGAAATDPVKIVTLPPAKTPVIIAKRTKIKNAAVTPVAPVDPTVEIQVNGAPLVDITPEVAKSAGAGSPKFLANAWAKNIRQALNLPDENALPMIPAASAPSAAAVPPAPTVPAQGS